MTRDLTAGARLSLTILALATVSAACGRGERSATADNSSSAVRSARPAHLPDRLGLGHTPTPARLAALDIDANPAGVGLPAGRGTYAGGARTYAQKCAVSLLDVASRGAYTPPDSVGGLAEHVKTVAAALYAQVQEAEAGNA